MRERLAALRQLSAVYQMVEEMHSVEARRAAAEVTEAQGVIHAEETCTHEGRMRGREALLTDDRAGWSLAVVHEEIAHQRKKQLEPILEEREERSDEARKQYLQSRLWSERIKSLIDGASARTAAEEERRAQAAADDRFLAWTNSGSRERRRLSAKR
jgi:hypothetical protein